MCLGIVVIGAIEIQFWHSVVGWFVAYLWMNAKTKATFPLMVEVGSVQRGLVWLMRKWLCMHAEVLVPHKLNS